MFTSKVIKAAVFSVLLCFTQKAKAEAPPYYDWQKSMGGTSMDEAAAVITLPNGHYLLGGTSNSTNGNFSTYGSDDFIITETDANGNILWQNHFGGTNIDKLTSLKRNAAGEIFACGYTASNNTQVTGQHGLTDIWLIKTDASGNLIWQRTFGGSANDVANAMILTSDGGLLIGGSSESSNGNTTNNHGSNDFWIVKTDGAGNLQWQKSLGGSGYDFCYTVCELSNTNFIVAGTSNSNNGDIISAKGGNDLAVFCLNSTGNILWQNNYGGSNHESAFDVLMNPAGNLLFCGYTQSNDGDVSGNHGGGDAWLIEIGTTGNIVRNKCYGGTNGESFYRMSTATDGNILVCGSSLSSNGDLSVNYGGEDAMVIKVDQTGTIRWAASYGGNATDRYSYIHATADGGFIAGGFSFSNNQFAVGNHGSGDAWMSKLTCGTPVTDFSLSRDTICPGVNLSVINNTIHGAIYSWYVNDSLYTTATDLSLAFVANGSYRIKLVSATCYEIDSIEKNVIVYQPVPSLILANTAFLCGAGNTVTLNATPAEGYLWNTGNTSSSITVSDSGNYSVSLFQYGCVVSSLPFQVQQRTAPTFSLGNDTSICSTLSITLHAPQNMITYQWQNGNSDSLCTATASGIYFVTVSDGFCQATDSIVVNMHSCQLPIASFTQNDASICQSSSVNFTDLSVNATSWHWYFQGATPNESFDQHPQNILYGSVGTFNVTLVVSNSDGTNTLIQNSAIVVHPTPQQPQVIANGIDLTSSVSDIIFQWYFNGSAISGETNNQLTANQSGFYSVLVANQFLCWSKSDSIYITTTGLQSEKTNSSVSVFPNPAKNYLNISAHDKQIQKIKITKASGAVVLSQDFNQVIDISSLSSGLYFLKGISDKESFTTRFVVE